MKDLNGKRVVITGAASGLGRALALKLAKESCRLGLCDINLEGVKETLSMAEAAGAKGFAVKTDVTKPAQVKKLAEKTQAEFGGVDVVINNAGVAAGGYIGEIPLEDWQWIVGVNMWSVIYGCHEFVPIMKKQGSGHIVNVASSAGICTFPEMGSYNLTKAAVIGLSETLRLEMSAHNIGVTVVCPTFFSSNLMDSFRSTDERQRQMANAFFAKASMTSEDIADATIKAIRKNKLHVIPQLDGRAFWILKRLSPRLYYELCAFGYKRGLMDRFLFD